MPVWIVVGCVVLAVLTAALAGTVPRVSMAMTALAILVTQVVGFVTGPWH